MDGDYIGERYNYFKYHRTLSNFDTKKACIDFPTGLSQFWSFNIKLHDIRELHKIRRSTDFEALK